MVQMIKHTSDPKPFPQKLRVVLWAKEEVTDYDDVELNSIIELNTLLQEVKQFNCDPDNKEHGIYKTIINH